MDMDNLEARLDDLVHELWSLIMGSIKHVVEADKSYGFAKFEALANPSIDEILSAIQVIDPMVSAVLNHPHTQADPVRTMQVLNCQQAIHLIRRTHVSLKNGDEAEYQSCISKIKSQKP